MRPSQSVADRSLVAVADDGVRVRWIRARAAEHGVDESAGEQTLRQWDSWDRIDCDHDNVSPEKDTLFSSFPINLSPELGVSPTLPRTCDCGITAARIHHQPGRLLWKLPWPWEA